MHRISTLLAVGVLAAGSTLLTFQDQDDAKKSPEKEKERIVVPASDDKAIERRDFMRTKMLFTQNIFEGLTRGDFEQINSGIEKVQNITEGGGWVEIDDPIYRKLTEDFNMTTRRLEEAAKSKNIDAVALRFYQMSTSCIDCHKHIREAAYEL